MYHGFYLLSRLAILQLPRFCVFLGWLVISPSRTTPERRRDRQTDHFNSTSSSSIHRSIDHLPFRLSPLPATLEVTTVVDTTTGWLAANLSNQGDAAPVPIFTTFQPSSKMFAMPAARKVW